MSDNKNGKKSFLTPCRTVGLKRKSLGSSATLSNPINDWKTPSTPVSTSKEVHLTDTPIKSLSNDGLSKQQVITKLKFDDTDDSNDTVEMRTASVVCPVKEMSMDNNALVDAYSEINVTTTDLDNVTVANLDYQINVTKKSISFKIKKVEELELDLVNVKQHDLVALNKLIVKWRTACQEALNELCAEYQKQGKPCSVLVLLNTLGISPELARYSEMEMDFYE